MQETQATIAVAMLSSAGAGIVLGSIIACCNIIRAKRQRVRATGQQVAPPRSRVSNYLSSQADITDNSGAGGLAGFGRIAPGGGGGGGPAPRLIFPVTLFAVTIVLAVGGGALYWHHTSSAPPSAPRRRRAHTSKGSEFERVYSQLGIQPLPSNVERQQQVQSRLAQLSREACYTDAIVGLGRALLDAGYPREAATSLRTFVKRCGSASEVLPLAYSAFEQSTTFPPLSKWQMN